MTALHVLHVTPYSEWAWAHGGIPRVVAAQTRGLALAGVTTTVLTTDASDREQRLARPSAEPRQGPFRMTSAAGSEVVVCPNLSNWLAARLRLDLPRGAAAYMVDGGTACSVGHLHACRNLIGVVAARHLVRAGVPFVLQPNGTAPRSERWRLVKTAFDAVFGRSVLHAAAGLITVTEVERRRLAALGLAAPITVIPNPVDLDEYAIAPDPEVFRNRWHLGDRPLVLFLGQLSPRKRIDLALHAIAAIDPARRPDLVVAGGDMGRRRSLETLARDLGIAPRVVFTGVLPGRRRLEALAAADAVVYPSRDEVFGLVPLEALLCGSPVVVSGDCGCGEVVAAVGGGLVIEHGRIAALTDAITTLLTSPEAWRQRAADAAVRVRERFSAAAVATQLIDLYQSLADTAAGAAR